VHTPPYAYLPSCFNLQKKTSNDDLASYSLDGGFGDSSPYSLYPSRGNYVSSGNVSPIHVSPPVTSYRSLLAHNPYGLPPTVSREFMDFVSRTLSQTLLSPAAVLLTLWYIRRFAVHTGGGESGATLRQVLTEAVIRKGPEAAVQRVVVLGLACSNKWLDDNTFTNKSW
jgi:hypothetical protein